MQDSKRHLFAIAFAGMVVFGMLLALPGTVIALPEFSERFHLTLSARGLFIAALFGGLLLGSLISGPVVDRFGYRFSIAAPAATIAALLPAFTLAASYRPAVLALLGLGLSSATLNTAANALASDLFPLERGRRMTMLAVAFSLGGLLLPTTIAAAAQFISWRAVLLSGAGLSALIAVAALIVRAPPRAEHAIAAAIPTLFGRPGLARFCVLLACGAANEGAFAGWTSSYLTSFGFTPVAATWGLSSHWLGLLAGRLAFANRVDRAKARAIVASATAGAVILTALVAVPVRPVLAVGPFAAGVAIGIIVPTSLALAGERVAANPGALFGLLLTMAQIGGMILPPLMGVVADRLSLRVALVLAIANVSMIAILVRQLQSHSTSYSKGS